MEFFVENFRKQVFIYGLTLIMSVLLMNVGSDANAAGIYRLTSGKARTLINIGGQDVKVIRLSETGQILDFRMNDKCAAGTGRFFEMAARHLIQVWLNALKMNCCVILMLSKLRSLQLRLGHCLPDFDLHKFE